jgi:hypothetical protein
MPINPVAPGPVFGDAAYQSALRSSEATARSSRESDERPQATVPEADQRVSPNQAGSESNGSRSSADNSGNQRLDIYV